MARLPGGIVIVALALGAVSCSSAPEARQGGTAGTSGSAGAAGSPGGAGGTAGSGMAGSGMAGSGMAGSGVGGTGLGGLGGTPARPVLSDEQARDFTVLAYLAKTGAVAAPTTDDWDPTEGAGDVASFTPAYTVAEADGTHTSVQAAITEAATAGGTDRIFIHVMPGTYREVVCVPVGAPPITLYGTGSDPSETTIVYDHLAGSMVDSVVNPCVNPSGTTYGTGGSATFAVYGSDFHAKNLTISNDADESTATGAVQGVALNTRGDRLVFEDVHLLGNQDTVLVGTTNVGVIQRAYFKNATVEGDVDFICGRGTAVFDGGTIRLATDRRANGNLLAPSTDTRNPYGFLIIGATLTAADGAQAGGMTLGRSWDESQVDVATYTTNVMTGVYPNGQAVIRDSTLGEHVNGSVPWASAATTSRPYRSVPTDTLPANRLYEFGNTGP
jgi:pectinesterase